MLYGELEAKLAEQKRKMQSGKQKEVETEHLFESAYIPRILEPLACEARKYPDFEEFAHDFSLEIKHGQYYHFTNDPNFYIDPEKGPRDMSSMAFGEMERGKLMITSDLGYWADMYPNRKYVAVIDMCDVPKEKYSQVDRGFGNEFYVDDPSKAKVVAVIARNAAYARDRRYHAKLPQSKEKLKSFWEKVWGKEHLT